MNRLRLVSLVAALGGFAFGSSCSCGDDGDDGADGTSEVGTFDGLFDVAAGFNFPFDIGIMPDDPLTEDDVEPGDIYIANYGTSEIMFLGDPSGQGSVGAAGSFFDGTSQGLEGATAISISEHRTIWATFEQGGANGNGGLVVLDEDANVLSVLDSGADPDAFANPGGVCWGGSIEDDGLFWAYMINLGDGTAWRVEASDATGADAAFVKVGGGLATGTPGNPGSPGNGLTSSKDLPEGGARGCAYHGGSLYVADAQNARVVRFDGVDDGTDLDGVALEDTPAELVTYPTDVAVNEAGDLIVISYDNAHAFVSLELPGGGFLDNGLHDLNVNAGNYGTALANDTIWFTRANNSNGSLRAITPEQDVRPSTEGPFPPQ